MTVLRTQPVDGADQVAVEAGSTLIALQFSSPVVPLSGVAEEEGLPSPIEVNPPVAGEGRWMNTSLFTLTPSEDLLPATRYTVTVGAGLEDFEGEALTDDYEFSFVTTAPTIRFAEPGKNGYYSNQRRHVHVSTAITVTFSQAMDRVSTEEAFELRGPGPAEGAFSWPRDDTIVFTPYAPLAHGATYTGSVAATARSAVGSATLSHGHNWTFTTAQPFGIAKTVPGNRNVPFPSQDFGRGFRIEFTTPVDREGLRVSVQPSIDNIDVWPVSWRNWSEVGVGDGWQASTAYTVTIFADTRSVDGETLGADATVRFSIGPVKPWFSLKTPNWAAVYSANRIARAFVSAVNISSVNVELRRVPSLDLAPVLGSWGWVRDSGGGGSHRYTAAGGERLGRYQIDTEAETNQPRLTSTNLRSDPSDYLPPGAYLIAAASSKTPADHRPTHLMLVSQVNLLLKRHAEGVLVWATDLETGTSVTDLPVVVADKSGVIASGTTDDEGVFVANIEFTPDRADVLVAYAEVDGAIVGATGAEWSDGIRGWDYGLPYERWPSAYQATIYTDRPIYRPGHTVWFRGVLRKDDDVAYSLPDRREVPILITDSRGKDILDTEVEIGEFGTFHGEIELSEDAPLGTYNILLHLGPDDTYYGFNSQATFRVAAYRKPAYEVAVSTEHDSAVTGDTVFGEVAANYYFGGPVQGADVVWRVKSEPYAFRPQGFEGWWAFEDPEAGATGEQAYLGYCYGCWYPGSVDEPVHVAEGEGELGADGALQVDFKADLEGAASPRRYVLDADVTDLGQQAVSSRTELIVHPASEYIGLRPLRRIGKSEEPTEIQLVTVDTQGITVTNRAVRVLVYEREWRSVREQREDGGFYWQTTPEDTLQKSLDTATDELGAAVVRFTPQRGGLHRIVAQATDARGNAVRSATAVWVSTSKGYSAWARRNDHRIDLIPDREEYRPGDVAEILVASPYESAEALLTVERSGIVMHRHVSLAGNSEIVRVPIEEGYIPNVYVSVSLVRGGIATATPASIKVGYLRLPVSTDSKKLMIELEPDRETHYQPGETATWRVSVADAAGEPVRAELSLALVDKAVLALATDTSPSLHDSFFFERSLGVATSASLIRSADAFVEETLAETKGGGGGYIAGDVRTSFKDTAYWNASVVTDEEGKAEVGIELPDNLTTWQLVAKAVSGADLLVGEKREEIVATRDVIVRPIVPRFAVAGDRLRLGVVVHNNTGADRTFSVTLGSRQLELTDEPVQELFVADGAKSSVSWLAGLLPDELYATAAHEAAGQVHLEVAAVARDDSGKRLSDAVRYVFPVYRYTSLETTATMGQVSAKTTEQVRVPLGVEPDQGELRLELNPSLAAASTDGLTWLETYPYGCAEQTTSSFLPNVAAYIALQELGLERPDLKSELEREVSVAIQRLYQLQRPDGGWGWWANDESRTWLTSYALFGLDTARRAGFAVDGDVIERATEALLQHVNRRFDPHRAARLNEHAFALFVLRQVESGDFPRNRAVKVYESRQHLTLEGSAFLALALSEGAVWGSRRGDAASVSKSPEVATLLSDVVAKSKMSATGTHWKEESLDRSAMASTGRTNAVIVLALSQIDAEHYALPSAVRWIMSRRREGNWTTTQDTAWTVMALTAFMRATGELEGRAFYEVRLDDQLLGAGRFEERSFTEPVEFSVPLRELATHAAESVLESAAHNLMIRRKGDGRLYYGAYFRLYYPADGIEPMDRGIAVEREYLQVDPLTYEPTGEPLEAAAVGDVVMVRLRIVAPTELHYFILEDSLPAGFEAIDAALETVSASAQGARFSRVHDDEDHWWWRGWWSSWTTTEMLDHKVAAFATHLSKGVYEYSYLMRATLAGEFGAMPARAEEMYFPEVFGRSEGTRLVVSP